MVPRVSPRCTQSAKMVPKECQRLPVFTKFKHQASQTEAVECKSAYLFPLRKLSILMKQGFLLALTQKLQTNFIWARYLANSARPANAADPAKRAFNLFMGY